MRILDRAEHARLHPFIDEASALARMPLITHLGHQLLITRRHFAQHARLVDGVGQRLFAIDVLARVERIQRTLPMPVVNRGDEHGVNVRSREHFAEVAIHRAIVVAVLLVSFFLHGKTAFGLHIANGDELHTRFVDETFEDVRAAIADAAALRSPTWSAPRSPLGPPANAARKSISPSKQG